MNIILTRFRKVSPSKFLLYSSTLLGLLFYFYYLFKAYDQRFAAFGCFDECFNYVAGYFMLKGKSLYSQIYFNHQPLMAYISFYLQSMLKPSSLYHLVLYHKYFVLTFGFLMDIVLFLRFRWFVLPFIAVFESTKFYFMGNFFIPESLIVYPFVYLMGLVLYKFTNRKISKKDIILSSIFTFFIVFIREPYVLAALFIYLLILWNKKFIKIKIISLVIFLGLSLFLLLNIDVKEYLRQVYLLNRNVLAYNVSFTNIYGTGMFKVFFYPVFIFLYGKWSLTRIILISTDLLFMSFLVFFYRKTKNIILLILVFIILGMSNIRLVQPGEIFYGSFHMMVWYSLFLFTTFFFLFSLINLNYSKKIKIVFLIPVIFLSFYSIFSPKSFLRENINKEIEYSGNFKQYFVYGEVVRLLSKPNDTLFVAIWEDLIYWQSGLDSPYKYSTAGAYSSYLENRDDLFKNNAPTFYYAFCEKKNKCDLPVFVKKDYVQLYYVNDLSPLFVKKSRIEKTSQKTWDDLKILRFYLKI